MTRTRRQKQRRGEAKRLAALAWSSDPAHRTQAAELVFLLDYAPPRRGKATLPHYRQLPRRMLVRQDGLVLYIARCRNTWTDNYQERATILPPRREAVDRSWAGTDLFDLALRVDAVYPLEGR